MRYQEQQKAQFCCGGWVICSWFNTGWSVLRWSICISDCHFSQVGESYKAPMPNQRAPGGSLRPPQSAQTTGRPPGASPLGVVGPGETTAQRATLGPTHQWHPHPANLVSRQNLFTVLTAGQRDAFFCLCLAFGENRDASSVFHLKKRINSHLLM